MESSLIYVPDIESYECVVVRDSNTIRAYRINPTNNSTVSYRDYFVNSHYLYKDDFEYFSETESLPICLDSSSLTTAFSYRNDLADILFIAFCIIFAIFYLVSTCIKCLFKGRKLF